MSRSAYGRTKCYTCDKELSNAGFAVVAHKRKHVREGELVELAAPEIGRPNIFVRPGEVEEMLNVGYYRRIQQ